MQKEKKGFIARFLPANKQEGPRETNKADEEIARLKARLAHDTFARSQERGREEYEVRQLRDRVRELERRLARARREGFR